MSPNPSARNFIGFSGHGRNKKAATLNALPVRNSRSRSWQLTLATMLSVLVMESGTSHAFEDILRPVSGSAIRGKITGGNPQSIEIQSDGKTLNIAPWNIRRIKLDDEPSELEKAKSAYSDERYTACLTELDRLGDGRLGTWIEMDRDFYRAMATAQLAAKGQNYTNAQAEALLKSFSEKYGNSYRIVPIADIRGDIAMRNGDFVLASEQFAIVGSTEWPGLSFSAQVKNGRALLRQDRFQEAIDVFELAEQVTVTTPIEADTKLIAACMKAQALARTNRADEGIAIVENIIATESYENKVVFAYAYNAWGTCCLAKNQLMEAAHKFLHTDLLFFGEPDAHAEALYELQRLWGQLDRAVMASEARQKLQTRYRNTYWNTRGNQAP